MQGPRFHSDDRLAGSTRGGPRKFMLGSLYPRDVRVDRGGESCASPVAGRLKPGGRSTTRGSPPAAATPGRHRFLGEGSARRRAGACTTSGGPVCKSETVSGVRDVDGLVGGTGGGAPRSGHRGVSSRFRLPSTGTGLVHELFARSFGAARLRRGSSPVPRSSDGGCFGIVSTISRSKCIPQLRPSWRGERHKRTEAEGNGSVGSDGGPRGFSRRRYLRSGPNKGAKIMW